MLKLVDDLLGVLFFRAKALHHFVPEFTHFVGWPFVHFVVAFAGIRARNHYLCGDGANIL